MNIGLQVLIYALTAVFRGRWQAQTHFARLPGGALDPMYLRSMSTHWIRAALITLSGLLVFWMVVQDLSSQARRVP
jgi:hypothetical protein